MISNGYSAIVPLLLSDPSGTLVDGKAVAKATAVSVRVIVVDHQPVLTLGAPPWMSVVLYGHPGVSYDLESTTALPAPSWRTVTNVTLTAPFRQFDGLGLAGSAAFYRARQL